MAVDVTIRVRVDTPDWLDDDAVRGLDEAIRSTEVALDIRAAVGRAVSRQFRADLDGFSVGAIEVHCTQRAPRA